MTTGKRAVKILCTLGPASLNARTISRLTEIGVDVFRINLSHTALKDVRSVIQTIRAHTRVPICLDTEGAQVRNTYMQGGRALLEEGREIRIHADGGEGDATQISLNHDFVLPQLKVGDLLSIDFDTALLQIISVSGAEVRAVVLCGGVIGSNKAVHVDRHLELPALTPKDREALQIGLQEGIHDAALSFANRKEDVQEIRSLVGKDWFIISKIESQRGLSNLSDIAGASDAILIDRGDLSNEESLAKIPFLQKHIIRTCTSLSKPVYVATNLLESMLQNSRPTRAEVNDGINTLMDGASGLVLAAETAIGKHPIASAHLISRLIDLYSEFRQNPAQLLEREHLGDLLIPPVGGLLVQQFTAPLANPPPSASLKVTPSTMDQAELIATGVLSPLRGFPGFHNSDSSVGLTVSKEQSANLKPGHQVRLSASDSSSGSATLTVDSIEAESTGDGWRIAGRVTLHEHRQSGIEVGSVALTPRQTRLIFERRGWTKILALPISTLFKNTEPPSAQALQDLLDKSYADGLFVMLESDSVDQTMRWKNAISAAKLARRVVLHVRSTPAFRLHSDPALLATAARNYGCSHLYLPESSKRHEQATQLLPTCYYTFSQAEAATQ